MWWTKWAGSSPFLARRWCCCRKGMAHHSPEHFDSVSQEDFIGRNNRNVLHQALRNQNPVERIAMMIGERLDVHDVVEHDRKLLDTVDCQLLAQEPAWLIGDLELAKSPFDHQLPRAPDAEKEAILPISEDLPAPYGEPLLVECPPQEDICIEQ